MPIKNNKGSSLLENMVATLVFSLIAVTVFGCFLAGVNLTQKASQLYVDRSKVFNAFEAGDNSSILVASGEFSTTGTNSASENYVSNIEIVYKYTIDGDIITFE